MIHKLEHIGIYAGDMDRSIAFYTEALGMKLSERVKLNDKVELAFLSFPGQEGVQVELIGRGTDGVPREGLVNHLAFTVSDIDAAIAKLTAAGAKMHDAEARTILDGRKIAFFEGPDGEKLELFQPAK